MVSTKPAKGTRDMLPRDVRRREYVVGVIKQVYEAHGFEPLETPSFERLETLLGKYGDEGDQLIFRILRRGKSFERAVASDPTENGVSDHALRYDLTVPLARVVAEYQNSLPRYFKRYQIQPVWRADRPAKGRFREFFQCDVDIIGSTSLQAEAEVMSAVATVLDRLTFDDARIRLNHRGVLFGLIEVAGISDAMALDALISVDKLDKIGWDKVAEELRGRGVSDASIERLAPLLDLVKPGDNATTALAALDDALAPSDQGRKGVAQLRRLVALTASTPAGARVVVDPSLARGLSYYTGPIFEIASPAFKGSLGGGGRYDDLIGMFSRQTKPAVGFSLGLERLLVLMDERDLYPKDTQTAPQVMVALMHHDVAPDALALAAELRVAGLTVDVYPDDDKLGKQFRYAEDRATRMVAILGPNEVERGEVALKDLVTGVQRSFKRGEVAAAVQSGELKPDA